MKQKLFVITIICVALVGVSYLLGSCRKDSPAILTPFTIDRPAGFPAPVYNFADNPLSKEGVALGKRLFYDGRLSVDNAHPCSSCHQQIAGFGTFEHDRSHGVNGSHTLRNAPVLFNLVWQPIFHWDGEFESLYAEAAHPITGTLEMGENFNSVVSKLKADPSYRQAFRDVFRSDITPDVILKAVAQFTGSMVSANSKYDRYKAGQTTYTEQEENGYQIFQANCATCHPEPLFTDYSIRNIGLPVDDFLRDNGRQRITGNVGDSLKFKVPTLRNVYISSNYMHDGRFVTLGQVITHYRSGVQPGPTVDPLVAGGIAMTNTEATNLGLFLRTLTDSSFLKDTRYSQ